MPSSWIPGSGISCVYEKNDRAGTLERAWKRVRGRSETAGLAAGLGQVGASQRLDDGLERPAGVARLGALLAELGLADPAEEGAGGPVVAGRLALVGEGRRDLLHLADPAARLRRHAGNRALEPVEDAGLALAQL